MLVKEVILIYASLALIQPNQMLLNVFAVKEALNNYLVELRFNLKNKL